MDPYDVAEKEAGLRPAQFQSAFGGYRSHDRLRERPFRIGRSPRGRFALKVDEGQALLLLGQPSEQAV